jgi:hypothetical protein
MAEARKDPRAFWQAAAVAALSVVASYNAVIQFGYADAFAAQTRDPYNVLEMEAKASRIADRIPVTEPVGYFSDAPFSAPAGQAAFFAAQYALAPRIVVRDDAGSAARARYWLGVFTREQDFAQAGAQRGLALEQDLGGYVILYRRQEAAR